LELAVNITLFCGKFVTVAKDGLISGL